MPAAIGEAVWRDVQYAHHLRQIEADHALAQRQRRPDRADMGDKARHTVRQRRNEMSAPVIEVRYRNTITLDRVTGARCHLIALKPDQPTAQPRGLPVEPDRALGKPDRADI